MKILNDLSEIVIIPFVEFMASPFVFLIELTRGENYDQKNNEKGY